MTKRIYPFMRFYLIPLLGLIILLFFLWLSEMCKNNGSLFFCT